MSSIVRIISFAPQHYLLLSGAEAFAGLFHLVQRRDGVSINQ